MDNLMSPAERRTRHRAWLASFGFSDEDWRRIREAAHQVTPTYAPPALNDLSVPVLVAVMTAVPRYMGAGKLGVITKPDGLKVAIAYWPMDDHEQAGWECRRKARFAS